MFTCEEVVVVVVVAKYENSSDDLEDYALRLSCFTKCTTLY